MGIITHYPELLARQCSSTDDAWSGLQSKYVPHVLSEQEKNGKVRSPSHSACHLIASDATA
jgi:hypothetical protein